MKTGKFAVSLVAAVVLSGSASMALAQDGYAGISLGQAEVKDFCDDLSGLDCDDTPLTGRIYAGGFFDQYLAFEGGYRYVDDATVDISIPEVGRVTLLETKYHMFDGSLIAYTPKLGPVRLFGKIGAQFWRQDFGGLIGGLDAENGISLRTGVGASIDLGKNFGVRLEWDYLKSIGEDDTTGIQNLKSDIHIFSAGPEFRF